jgi:hypothetical protein
MRGLYYDACKVNWLQGCELYRTSPGPFSIPGLMLPAMDQLPKSSIYWDITPFNPLKVNRRFGGTYRFHLQGRRNEFSTKACYIPEDSTAVRTSNPAQLPKRLLQLPQNIHGGLMAMIFVMKPHARTSGKGLLLKALRTNFSVQRSRCPARSSGQANWREVIPTVTG